MTPEEYRSLRPGFAARRKSKFGNVRTVVDGVNFDSRREASRWGWLKLAERAGEITDLKRQVSFDLTVNGVKVARYIADFTYRRAGALVCEDAKGVSTPIFKLKAKLMKAVHGIDVVTT